MRRLLAAVIIAVLALTAHAQSPFNRPVTNLKEALKNPDNTYHLKLENVWLSEKDIDKVSRLKNLQTLVLINNGLDSFPRVWCNFSRLLELHIEKNPVKELPPEFVNLYNLRKVSFKETKITSFPFTFSYLYRVNYLTVTDNTEKLSLPENMYFMKSLKELKIINTPLDTLPDSLFFCPKLNVLILHNDSIDELPVTIGNAQQLSTLILDNNRLTRLPRSFYRLTALTYCSLANNKITELSEECVNFKKLYEWNLTGNPLSDYRLDIIRILLPNCKVVF